MSDSGVTPDQAYYAPILELLVRRGGTARAGEIIEDLPSVIDLTDKDRQRLQYETRWRGRAKWARHQLMKMGLVSSSSPAGTWEITHKGRSWLSSALSTDSVDGDTD